MYGEEKVAERTPAEKGDNSSGLVMLELWRVEVS